MRTAEIVRLARPIVNDPRRNAYVFRQQKENEFHHQHGHG
jgi:hypothetical protein